MESRKVAQAWKVKCLYFGHTPQVQLLQARYGKPEVTSGLNHQILGLSFANPSTKKDEGQTMNGTEENIVRCETSTKNNGSKNKKDYQKRKLPQKCHVETHF